MDCNFAQKSMSDRDIFKIGMDLINQGYVESRKGDSKSGTEVRITTKGRKARELLGNL